MTGRPKTDLRHLTVHHRHRVGRVALVIALALGAPSCGDESSINTADTDSSMPASSRSPSSSPTTTASVGTDPDETTTARVYFLRDEKVSPVGRTVDGRTPARGALEALLKGPGDNTGHVSSIPSGTTLLGISVAGGVATVDLSGEFASGGGSMSMLTRVAQVVFTLTQFPTVTSVSFRIDGSPVDAIDGEGVLVDPPRTRSDFEDQTPAILVESPLPGTRLESPFTATGTSNTFEATYLYSLTDSAGTVLAEGFGTATSGTGTRGTFSQEIVYAEAAPGAAVLKLFESSANDGSDINVVEIPVELS